MKNILLFTFIFFSSLVYSSDGGNSYRFFVDVKLNDLYFSGYIYHNSYSEYNDKMQFTDYLIKELPNKKIKLYKQIKTLHLGSNYDFSVEERASIFNLTYNVKIRVKEILKFYNNDRLKLITEKEYNIIENNFPRYVNLIHENILFEENSSIIFFSWKNKRIINKGVKRTIEKLIFLSNKIKNSERLNSREFWNSFNKKKKELLKNKVIMFISNSTL